MKLTHFSRYLKFALFLAILCSFTTAYAYDFEVDGIYYNKTSASTVEVTYKSVDGYGQNYDSHSVDIPITVINNNITYTVTAIGDSAFYESYVYEVTIPSTITRIGWKAFYTDLLTYITCLATTPPEMGADCFPYHEYGYNRMPWYEIEGDYDMWDLFLYVPLESFDSYKSLNDIYNYFSFVIKIGADATKAPNVYELANGVVFEPIEGEMHRTSVLYNGPTNSMMSWCYTWDEDCFDSTDPEWGSSVYTIRYAYCVEEGKEPSEIVSGYGGYYSHYGYDEYNYDIKEQGLCFNMGWIVTSNKITTYYKEWVDGEESMYFSSYQYTNKYEGDIIIPSTVRYGNVTGINDIAFHDCANLNSVYIPNTIISINQEAFKGCSGLSIIDVESGNPVYDSRDNCNGVIETANNKLIVGSLNTEIPSSVTAIGNYAFYHYNNLERLVMPITVQAIGLHAFDGCDSIQSLFFTGDGAWSGGALDVAVQRLDIASGITAIPGLKVNPREVYSYAKVPPTCDETTFTDYTGTLHVPESSLAAYFTAPYWCNFANIVGDAVELTDLTLNKDSAELLVGEQLTLNATIQPTNANIDSITWESSNPSVATVTSDGVVTAKALGECDIIVTCLDKRAICHIKVVEQVTTITLDQHRASLLPNHILTLTPTVTPVPTDLVVTSSNPSVAAARLANGKVQVVGVSVGTAIIKVASADGNAIADSCFVNVYTEAGDVDGDGFVKIDDVTALIDHLLGSNSSIDVGNADINYDGVVSIADVTELIDYLLGGSASMSTRETFTVNGVSFTMIRVPAGSFMMGATEEQGSDANSWEKPVHEVTLSNSYLIGETEVTQELWLAVMGTNPSKHEGSLQKPVENVSWLDCQEFISRLNELTGLSFRMPTEAEWEYAARGANRSRGYKYAGSNDIADVGNVSSSTTMPVGSLQPNELNIYDMSGNVDEWVWDLFGYYTSEPQIDPTGPADGGSDHMYRGGSWYSGANTARVSYRFFRASTFKRGTMGLRLAL